VGTKPSAADSRTTRSPRTLRAWAALLVLAAVVPLLIFGGIILWWMAQRHADASIQAQTDTARVLASAVDGELRTWKAVLTALTQSQALQRGRLAEFYEEAKAVAAQQDAWINVVDTAGHQQLNTLRPLGSALPDTSIPDLLHAVVTQRQPVVGDLAWGRLTNQWTIAVGAPVVRNGTA